jgi:hypothetical protein
MLTDTELGDLAYSKTKTLAAFEESWPAALGNNCSQSGLPFGRRISHRLHCYWRRQCRTHQATPATRGRLER